ncbi:phosphate ABC transporter substrate-binding protein PstS [Actinacidiphila sp. DG2A-62]|uniref:phosphate ABC transporter substrate-binding protein PstS n=1 Tax=Actinacidiphila sp. DG2A-62 TaxID=3108821 RepID=UPI002DB98B4E|nr:phosphate ABC transporter substrate-binding protein PstS [Actinacidiphila sp. DG2A-62]MEC3995995.1 phosphate ABC transporter substrate-binding protein PstS [Actinacidiphila sp. DG2A-62]
MKLQRKSGLRALTVGAVAITGALVLTACGSDDNSGSDNSSSSPSAGGQSSSSSANASGISCEKGQILSSGSTAQQNAIEQWVKDYQQACPGATINYKPSSSGEGIVDFNQGTDAFAGSDSPLKPEEVASSKKVCAGGEGINIPMVGGPIAIGYNLPGVNNLVLDAPTLAKIFNNKITTWNDPAIKALNSGVNLPSTKIQSVHRQDDSGTTDNLTKYLGGAAKADWPYPHAKAWAGKGGQAAAKSSGVAALVKQTEGSIGYFELSYATSENIPTVKINTGASQPVEATTANASAGIAQAKVVGTGSDLALDLSAAYTTKADNAYPIVLVTYEIACDKGNKAGTLPLTKSFLNYIASDAGQAKLSTAGYAPLPTEIATKVRSTISTLS